MILGLDRTKSAVKVKKIWHGSVNVGVITDSSQGTMKVIKVRMQEIDQTKKNILTSKTDR